MITCFPIVQTPEDRKKKFRSIRRDLLCSSKLEFICSRLKKTKPKQVKAQSSQVDPANNFNSNSDESGNKASQLTPQSVHRYQSLQQVGRKKSSYKPNEGLNKCFNRTRTDWDHNFVGNKYIQKIKQELRSTKHTSFTHKQSEKCNLSDLAKHLEPFTIDQTTNFGKTQYRRGLSQEQLQRIKLLKQKRRNKIHQSLKQFEGKKKVNLMTSQINEAPLEKSQPISPWDDYPSQLSSMFMKKL